MDSKHGLRVNLKQYRRIDGKWQFCPVVKENGKPNPKLVLINGEPSNWKGGTFYLEWREDGKREQHPCGTTPREALDAWYLQMGIRSGEVEPPSDAPGNEGDREITVRQAISSYLRDINATKKKATYIAYRHDLEWFVANCKKSLVSRLDRSDIMHLFAVGREKQVNGKPLKQTTINKHVTVVLQAMRAAGATIELRKGDWPKAEGTDVEVYTPEELQAFFKACNEEEKLIFQVFLCTGFRAREVETLTWNDINWSAGTLAVRSKEGFSPKSYEVREVPVPGVLVDALKRRKMQSKTQLVFPSQPHPTRPEYGGKEEDAHMLELCKRIAHRAGLNCGSCEGTYTVKKGITKEGKTRTATYKYNCLTSPRCGKWYLHKWRSTFATNMVQSNIDVRSLQILLGHKHLSTTEKYLRSRRLADLRDKVEASTVASFLL
jgi:integrase